MSKTENTATTEEEIRRVLFQYCRGIDRLDWELVRSAFHADARLVYGRESSVEEFIEGGKGGLGIYSMTQHLVSNVFIELLGEVAVVEAYCRAIHRWPPDANGVVRDFLWGGRYVDRFERRGGGPWLIARRTVVHEWTDIHAVGETWAGASGFTQGGRAPDPWKAELERAEG